MRIVPGLVLLVFISGCAAPSVQDEAGENLPGPSVPPDIPDPFSGVLHLDPGPVQVIVDGCGAFHCFEPSIAVDGAGNLFVITADASSIWRIENGTGVRMDPVPLAPGMIAVNPTEDLVGGNSLAADAMLQSGPGGRIFFTALHGQVDNPKGSPLAGIHVASSADGGVTWDRNVFVPLYEPDYGVNFRPDRQWLDFAPDGTLYLSYQMPVGVPLAYGWDYGRVSRSDDGGLTWSEFTLVEPSSGSLGLGEPHGPVTALSNGDVCVPSGFDGATITLQVFCSSDRGSTFEPHTVVSGFDGTGFPMLAEDVDGTLYVGWLDKDGTIFIATSPDYGDTWSEPKAIVKESASAGLWFVPSSSGMLVSGFTDSGRTIHPWLVLIDGDLSERVDAEMSWAISSDVTGSGREASTDFPHFLVDGTGIAWVVSADEMEDRLMVWPVQIPVGSSSASQ